MDLLGRIHMRSLRMRSIGWKISEQIVADMETRKVSCLGKAIQV